MTSDQIGGLIRAIVSALGGYLVGRGLTDAGTVAAVAGAAATIGVAVWSGFTNSPKAQINSVAANPAVASVPVVCNVMIRITVAMNATSTSCASRRCWKICWMIECSSPERVRTNQNVM